jgi:hypothetical protein
MSICHLIIHVRTFTQQELGRESAPQGGFTLHACAAFPIIPVSFSSFSFRGCDPRRYSLSVPMLFQEAGKR